MVLKNENIFGITENKVFWNKKSKNFRTPKIIGGDF